MEREFSLPEDLVKRIESDKTINLMEFPPEVRYQVAVFVRYDDLMEFCATSKQNLELCKDDAFWKWKTYHDFGGIYDVDEMERIDQVWFDVYQYYRSQESLRLIDEVQGNNIDSVKDLLSSGYVDVNLLSLEGESALIEAIWYPPIIKLLLENGADPNIKDDNGSTALFHASANNIPETVALLLRGGADPNVQNDKGNTALIYASLYDRPNIITSLLKADADPNIQSDRDFPLLNAVRGKWPMNIRVLLNGGADPNQKDNRGISALDFASRMGYSRIVELLLNGGANPDIQDNNLNTPLMSASTRGNDEIVRILLERNADPNLEDNDGNTALTIALKEGYDEIVDTLRSYM